MSKKTSIIVVISILIIIISLIISIYMPNKEKIEQEKEDNSESYYLLKRNEKFGVINKEGEIIVEPNEESIIIPNQNRAVFICKNGEDEKVINGKNEEIFKQYNNVEAIELTNVITESIYEKNVLKFTKNNKYGLIDIKGNLILEAKYDEISSLGFKEGEILVKENSKYGIIDEKGNQLIKNIYDSIESDQYYSTEDGYRKSGYIVCNVTDEGYRYGYYDYEASKVLDTEYNQIMRLTQVKNTQEIYLLAAKNGQYGVFINNNKIINTQYQSISYDNGIGMFVVERTGQFGAINEKGKEILKTEYEDIQINGIYMYAKKGEEQKVFDKEGNEVNISLDTIIETTSNQDYYIKIEGENYSILNLNLETITKQQYKYIEYAYGKYFIATNIDGKTGVIDVDENIIIDFNYDLIQSIKDKNIIQAVNFENNVTEIYNNEVKNTLEMKNINIQTLERWVKVYNEEKEYYLDNNGNRIEDENQLDEIKKFSAVLKIGNFKRVTYNFGQYYYIDEN